MIKLSSKNGDIMLTPFSGAGSECVAAKMTGRHYIGFETEQAYCAISEERLTNTTLEVEEMPLFATPMGEEDIHDEACN